MGKNRDNEYLQALEACIDEGLIDEVHWVVKSGKEATVYLCKRNAADGPGLVAAKVYRPTMVRRFANDAVYRDGRMRGREHKQEARAMKRKNRIGREMAFAQWIGDEFTTLELLHRAGADVPAPIAHRGQIILMEYIGDEEEAAPTLAQAEVTAAEAPALLRRLLWNIELMLACDRVHGDLSAFNVLYDGRTLRLIDFPQSVDARFNHAARELLARDIDRVCSYFARFGVEEDGARVARVMWERFLRNSMDVGIAPALDNEMARS